MSTYKGKAPFRVEATRPRGDGLVDTVLFEDKFATIEMAERSAAEHKAEGITVIISDADDVVMAEA